MVTYKIRGPSEHKNNITQLCMACAMLSIGGGAEDAQDPCEVPRVVDNISGKCGEYGT